MSLGRLDSEEAYGVGCFDRCLKIGCNVERCRSHTTAELKTINDESAGRKVP